MVGPAPEFVLAFDAGCGPCSAFKSVVRFLDARGRIEFASLESADGRGLLNGIAPARRFSSFHLVRTASDAQALSGAEALVPLVRLLYPWGRLTSRMIEATPGGVTAFSFAYGVFSRLHRSCAVRSVAGGRRVRTSLSG